MTTSSVKLFEWKSAFCTGCGNVHVPARPNDTRRASYCPSCRATRVPQRHAQRRLGAAAADYRAAATDLVRATELDEAVVDLLPDDPSLRAALARVAAREVTDDDDADFVLDIVRELIGD